MFVNIIDSYRYIVAICDKELIGKKFEEGKFQLDVKENFYKSKPISEQTPKTKEEILNIIKKMDIEDATFNIVGKRSTETAIEAGIITSDQVGEIQGIPYALVLL
ncbi:MAG: DUF424 family protein [Nanoarchaeota archaeon]|nr:DUF424 family protein [Nanoarchaeota archaeon]